MERADWRGKRTDAKWLNRLLAHPEWRDPHVPFVEFCHPEWAQFENGSLKDPIFFECLLGTRSTQYPPGDFDPSAGYLIGFTRHADSAILVDLRPQVPRIIYDCCANVKLFYATAFDSVDEFVRFYVDQHGE